MGSEVGVGFDNERPRHEVQIQSFWLRETETTVEEYQACVNAGICTEPDEYNASHPLCNWGRADRLTHPVNCVDWYQSVQYCEWIGGRLPSESEWEYAARSQGKDITYPWGEEDVSCEYAIISESSSASGYGCSEGITWPVCSIEKGNTQQGLCDMSGNVYEVVQDSYHATYDGAPNDGSAWDGNSTKVRRGGDFTSIASYGWHRVSFRSNISTTSRAPNTGFRCAK